MNFEYAKDPIWADANNTKINLKVFFYGINEEVPFTASPDDVEEHGRILFANAVAGEYGPVQPFQPYIPSKEETMEFLEYEVQVALDNGAKSWGYNSIATAASYAESTNPQYAADAAALISWRDAVWPWAYAKLPNVVAGETWIQFSVDMPAQPPQPQV